jgi:hypothetical protein
MRSELAITALLAVVCTAQLLPAQQSALLKDYTSTVVTPPPAGVHVDPFYKKYADALGIPVLSSEKVPDTALLVARDIVVHMLAHRADLREAMIAQNWRVAIMAKSEFTTDIPEQRHLKKPSYEEVTDIERAHWEHIAKMSDREYWDKRARGLGDNPTTGAEENLLGYPGTRYYGENIFMHEFSHAIHAAIRMADPKLAADIQQAYRDAIALGLWKGSYGTTNADEYWAEGTQFWFYSNFEYKDGDRTINTPLDLMHYDPKLYELLSRVYPDHIIPVDVYRGKQIKKGPNDKSGAEIVSTE